VRRHERNINYAPERVLYFHIQPITFLLHTRYYHKKLYDIYCISFINKISKRTSVLNKQKLKFKTKVKQWLPLPFLRLSRNMNVYSNLFHSYILEHLHIFICIIYILIEVLILYAQRKMIPVTFTRTYINWLCKTMSNSMTNFKFMKALWRHKNAGIIGI